MKRRYWWGLGIIVLSAAIAFGVHTCRSSNFNADSVSNEERDPLQSSLSLSDVVLEQQDDNGLLLWRVKTAEVTYSSDNATAKVASPEGELYQDGQLLYRVKADRGIIRENGQIIVLRGNIVANGVQNDTDLKGEFLEWQPSRAVMVMRDSVIGSHPEMRLQANEVRVFDRESRMELDGKAIVSTVVEDPQVNPWLKLQSEAMAWQWELETITSQQPLRVERFQNGRITEVLTGQQGQAELAQNRVTITDEILVKVLDIPLEIASEQAIWSADEDRIDVDRPLKIVNQEEQLTLTAQQGQLDLADQTVFLTQDVLVLGQRNDNRLTTDRLTWNLANQTVLAEGNVNYQQGNPVVTVRGPRATGRIEEQTIVIDGGRVVTEIVPEFN